MYFFSFLAAGCYKKNLVIAPKIALPVSAGLQCPSAHTSMKTETDTLADRQKQMDSDRQTNTDKLRDRE